MDVFEQAARRGKYTFPFFPKTAPPICLLTLYGKKLLILIINSSIRQSKQNILVNFVQITDCIPLVYIVI